MTGLLLKDILVARKTLKTYVLIIALYMGMTAIGIFNIAMMAAMTQMVVMMLPISAFSFDEQAKWDQYALALPVKRSSIVAARYGYVLIMIFGATAFGLLSVVAASFSAEAKLSEGIFSIMTTLSLGIFVTDFLLPMSYKLGAERSRPYLYLIIFLPIVGVVAAGKLGLLDFLSPLLDSLSIGTMISYFSLLPLIGLVGLGVSFLVSCRIVAGKEF